jgi:hypothetical protein
VWQPPAAKTSPFKSLCSTNEARGTRIDPVFDHVPIEGLNSSAEL